MHSTDRSFIVKLVSWNAYAVPLTLVRQQVFVEEQQVPMALEWDGHDENAMHLLALNGYGEAIGCARLPGAGIIGRMAVLKSWRGKGVGRALLAHAIQYYQTRNIQTIQLSAQLHAIAFYQKAGFKICSAPYLDANILHVDMRL